MNDNPLTRVAQTLARRQNALLEMRVAALARAGLPIARAYVHVPQPIRVTWDQR